MFCEIQRSDIGAAPIYQTHQRSQVVDFSDNYMKVQATLLLRKSYSEHVQKIETLGELVNQSAIEYGTLDRGIIIRAFRTTYDPLMRQVWRNIVRSKTPVLTETNSEGIARVRSGNYAFILPSTIGSYVSQQEPCDLRTVGRFLMDRGYSLIIKKNFTGPASVGAINQALEVLWDTGVLARLRRQWWYEESTCVLVPSSREHRQTGQSSSPIGHTPLSILCVFAALVLGHKV